MIVSDLDQLPSVAAYLRRIGATAVNFKTATVTQQVNGYPKAVGTVRFSSSGLISVWGEAASPTPEEQQAIMDEWGTIEFPKIVTLDALAELPPGINSLNDPNVFVCHDFSDKIVMVHQRYDNQDGTKGFLPWTRWSDGKWRRMEPEVMPFFGLPGYRDHSTLFIHEGSKAARRVKLAIAGELGEPFPWMEQMRWGHHIGWIGGVHAVERSDWRKLASLGWKRVVIVADNDDEGKAIVPQIAQHFRCPTFALVFTDEWPDKFDLGDKWPEKMFGEEGQYIGQPYDRCLQPATWATDEHITTEVGPRGGEKEIRTYECRSSFLQQWAWIESVDQMVCLDMPHYRMPAGRFNQFIRPFSHRKDTLEHFYRAFSGNQMTLTYDPSDEGTIIRDKSGLQSVNLYQPSPIKPVAGDYTPWLDFLNYLFPVEQDRQEVKRWIATLRAKPATRMIYGLLLMSEIQGTGKGTFASIAAKLVGEHNAAAPSASLIVNSDFNGWLSGKRLVRVDEIYEGQSWKAYNRLKQYVTDEMIEINVKHQATWSMPNWTHYILMSNSQMALRIENSDRRWLVPRVTETKLGAEFFEGFYYWLDHGGLSIIAHWAHTFEARGEGKYVRPGEIAPMTERKARLIDESRSDAEQLFLSLAEEMQEREQPTAAILSSLRLWASGRLQERVYETPQGIARILRSAGLWITDKVKIGGAKVQVICNREEMLDWTGAKLKDHIVEPNVLVPPEM